MQITVTGASGFIGRSLLKVLGEAGHQVRTLGRTARPNGFVWDPMAGEPPAEGLEGASAVVHLAGEPIAQRWSNEVKQKIRDSRVQGTLHLVRALSTMSSRPQVLISASAIGYYGNREDETLTEESAPGEGFLPEVCVEWEEQAKLAEALGIRVVRLRTGIVLGHGGGALEKMLPPFRAGAGGRLGSGKQWMSWIHVDDLAGLIAFALANPIQGALNGVSPNPVVNADFTTALGQALHRPAVMPVPALMLRGLFGEMSDVLLGSQRVLPEVARKAGFSYRYPEVGAAIAAAVA